MTSDQAAYVSLGAFVDELARAAGALRSLVDYLERNPQSILTGKDAPK